MERRRILTEAWTERDSNRNEEEQQASKGRGLLGSHWMRCTMDTSLGCNRGDKKEYNAWDSFCCAQRGSQSQEDHMDITYG